MKNTRKLENNKLKMKVKTMGAELISLQSKTDGTEYIRQVDLKAWNRFSPILFPIIGRLSSGVCRINGKEYKIPMHGFAKDSLFKLVKEEKDILAFQLQDNEQTRAVYPYKFTLTVEYTLIQYGLNVGFKVKNENDEDMFFSIGAHPAFACPMEKNLSFSDYYLQFNQYETADRWYIENGGIGGSERFLDNNNTIQLTDNLFDRDALIFKGLKSNSVKLKSDKSNKAITVDFTGFTHLGIWSRGKGASFVCIEPWYGIDDEVGFCGEIKEKEGILALKPGEIFTSSCTMTPR
jgi:galactose mutarotase-like enzyme